MFERLTRTLLLIIVAVLPFEFYVLPGDLSILQLLFIAALAIGLPVLIRNRRALISDRLVIAAICFTAMFWVTALLAPDNTSNAVKAAVRVTSGLVLMCMWISVGRTVPLGK